MFILPKLAKFNHRHLLFLSCLLLICAITAYIGAVPTRRYGHDIFFLLDNGWRVINGQRPHIDYASGWGPVTFLINAIGLKVSNYAVDGIGYGNVIFAFLIGLWCYLLSENRLGVLIQYLLSLSLAGLVLAPYALGSSFYESSHAMVYNRYGYALLSLILIETFQTAESIERGSGELAGGFSSGAAIALALFLKLSYFFVALMLLFGISLLLWRLSRRRLLGLLFGFFLVALVLLAYLNFNIGAILSDLQMTVKARSASFTFGELLRKTATNVPFYVAILSSIYMRFLLVETNRSRRRLVQLLLAGSLVFFADIFLLFSNAQWRELPLIAVFALLQMNGVGLQFQKLPKIHNHSLNYLYIGVMLIGTMIFLPRVGRDFLAIFYGACQKAFPSHLSSVLRFSEPRLFPLLLYDFPNSKRNNGSQYTMYVNDGVTLLRKSSTANETVITMDMTNPFPYAMGRCPPIGGIAAAAYKYTLSDSHRPSDDKYFGTADIVMVPKHPAAHDIYYYGYYKIYEQGLKQRFYLAAESDLWYLYKRKK